MRKWQKELNRDAAAERYFAEFPDYEKHCACGKVVEQRKNGMFKIFCGYTENPVDGVWQCKQCEG